MNTVKHKPCLFIKTNEIGVPNSIWVRIASTALIFLLAMSFSTNAQTVQWTRTYGSTGQDGGQAMVMTNDGGIVIAGFKAVSTYGYKDVLLMKTDQSGNELWTRMYSLGLNDIARSLCQTADGGFIIAGMTEVTPQIFDPFLLKTDSSGIEQWRRQYDYGFGDDDRAHGVWQTSDGGYVIAGQTWLIHGAFGNYDMYIVKTDASGNVQWTKVFFREEEGGDAALSIQQLSDQGYIIGGLTQSSTWASYVIRTDSLGNAVWSNIYPGAWQSECYDIQAAPDGGFIFTGTESSYQTGADVLITKLSSNGSLVWKKIYGSVQSDQGQSIRRLQDGGYIVTGMSAATGGYDMYVLRTNPTGDSIWSALIGGSGDDRSYAVAPGPSGSYYVAGWSWSYGLGQGDVYLAKLTESLTGFTQNNSAPGLFALQQNFPNPFNPTTTIAYHLPQKGTVKLTVYDIAGRTVSTLVDENQNAGTHSVKFSGEGFPSGIYFYTLAVNGNRIDSKKMTLVK